MCDCNPFSTKYGKFTQLSEQQIFQLIFRLPQILQKKKKSTVKQLLRRPKKQFADYVFFNGPVLTMNRSEEIVGVGVVVVRDRKIVYAGSVCQRVLDFVDQETTIYDLDGKCMLPGFIDPHVHMSSCMTTHFVDLSPFTNKDSAEIKKKILDAAKAVGKGQWIKCILLDPTITQGEPLTVSKKDLDILCPENPIVIFQVNGHFAHANSLAFTLANIPEDAPDPIPGIFVRDAQGKMTGQLRESAIMVFNKFIFPRGKYYQDNFKKFLSECSSKGITCLNDGGIGTISPQADISLLNEIFCAENNPTIRFSGFLSSIQWQAWQKLKLKPEYSDPYLRIHGIKCWSDGSLQGGSGYVSSPYLNSAWSVGKANLTSQKLAASIQKAHMLGWQVAVHSNGDAAIDLTLNAFASVVKKHPKPQLRHRLQHCTMVTKPQLEKMRNLNLSPSFLIGHVYYYGKIFRDIILGGDRAESIDPVRSALDYGLKVSCHSDFYCTPVGPIRCIYNAATRIINNTKQVLGPHQCISTYQAIKTVTSDAAWQCHMDDIVGSIEVGKKADLVILDKNPLDIDKKELINLKVVNTWMDGRRTYEGQAWSLKSVSVADFKQFIKKSKVD